MFSKIRSKAEKQFYEFRIISLFLKPVIQIKLIKPYKDQPGSRKEQVKSMFNNIAGRYDFLNHFLSFNMDRIWRRKLKKRIKKDFNFNDEGLKNVKILDIATGTGDLAFTLSTLKPASITGIDLAEEMLVIARKKSMKKEIPIEFILADSEHLPFNDDSFELVTVAFGVRNFENLPQGLNEMLRVLTSEGMLYILEFSKPSSRIYGIFYNFYSRKLLPVLASFFSSDKSAYHYLPGSIAEFPSGQEMLEILRNCGFKELGLHQLSGGIATIYYGRVRK